MKKYLIVGAGFSGAVIAQQLSCDKNNHILIMDERNHIGGNCYSERDPETNIMIHKYGPHVFHTDSLDVWNYLQQFCEMKPFVNRIKTVYGGRVYSLPVNLHTINQFFNKAFSPNDAKAYIDQIANKSIQDPKNFEEQALKFIGQDLYRAFFYGYTKKQWGCEPKKLSSSILKRLPLRFNYDDNYYNDLYQGIPKDGYTAIFDQMLSANNIEIMLSKKFDSSQDLSDYEHVFYTGPIDGFFHYAYGRLSYRTVYFKEERAVGDFQGNPIMNYADEAIPYTRIYEHKHFTPWEQHEKTIYSKEYSKETEISDIPYYPKRLAEDMLIYQMYREDAEKLHKVSFVGRLATYRYMDMHHVIKEAYELAQTYIRNSK